MLKKTYLHSGFVKGGFPQKLAAAGFPGVPVVKSPPYSARDISSISGLRRCHVARSKSAPVPRLLSPCAVAPQAQVR